MTDALTTYLQDHLAGAMHAVELLKAMRNHHGGGPLGQFASELLSEIEADRDLLAGLTEKAGGTPGGMKEWAAWMVEKVSRLKLKHGGGTGWARSKRWSFWWWEFTENGHCGAHCPSLQFAIHYSRVPISSSLRRALKISTTRSTREGLNARSPRSVRPPNKDRTIRPRFTTT